MAVSAAAFKTKTNLNHYSKRLKNVPHKTQVQQFLIHMDRHKHFNCYVSFWQYFGRQSKSYSLYLVHWQNTSTFKWVCQWKEYVYMGYLKLTHRLSNAYASTKLHSVRHYLIFWNCQTSLPGQYSDGEWHMKYLQHHLIPFHKDMGKNMKETFFQQEGQDCI
jgi:hypothetical protein